MDEILLTETTVIVVTLVDNDALAVEVQEQGMPGPPGAGAALHWGEVPVGTRNGINPTFTLAHAPALGKLMLSLNGLMLREGEGDDYTIVDDTITIEEGAVLPIASDNFLAFYSL